MILERILANRQGLSLTAPVFPPARGELAPGPLAALWIEVAGVLYDDTLWWRWLAQLISHAGVHIRHDGLQQAWECEYLRGAGRGQQDVWLALRRCLVRLGVSPGHCDELIAAAAGRQKQLDNALHPLPEVRTALADLARNGWSLVALASVGCPIRRMTEQLRSLGLAKHFQRFVGADDREFPPSAPGYYLELCETLDSAPHRTGLASNKPIRLSAAGAAGLTTVAIGCQARADLQLDLLGSLPRQLGRSRSLTRAA